MDIGELEYELPQELIAQQPSPQRSASRVLVVDRSTGNWRELRFSQLGEILRPDDVLVLNNTRVLPARFFLQRHTGGVIEGLWIGAADHGDWRVMLRDATRVQIGERLRFRAPAGHYEVTLVGRGARGEHRLRVSPSLDPQVVLADVGVTPLPPYIKRKEKEAEQLDRQRYQTVFARQPGAVAAPTAGLHFDEPLLAHLRDRGITFIELTLHVGPGTFAPIEATDLRDHVVHAERYEVATESWHAIRAARNVGRRIVAVGSTTARVLETIAHTRQFTGETDLFIYPPYTFRMVDGLITNFHLPRSTLLAMIYAFGGSHLMRRAYSHAIAQRFRFYSYGDAMLIV